MTVRRIVDVDSSTLQAMMEVVSGAMLDAVHDSSVRDNPEFKARQVVEDLLKCLHFDLVVNSS